MLLRGIKVIEFGGLAPAPFCGKILSDFGASVVRIDKPNSMPINWLDANKRSIQLNLKKKSSISIIQKMCSSYDVLIDPYRPGILEKLGLGPSALMKANPRLIYARLSGYGQTGPMADAAGHDINYVALSGILSMLGRKETVPTPPINLLADFAGGGLLCAFGIVLALYDRNNTGKGQVVDASMAEGAAYVSSFLYNTKNTYLFDKPRGENWLDSGAHFYDTYETKDGRHLAVGAIEPQFYNQLLEGLGLTSEEAEHLGNFEKNKTIFEAKFKEKKLAEWEEIFSSLDACVVPVLSLEEAPLHPHNVARENFRKVRNEWEPVATPRLTDSKGQINQVMKERSAPNPPCPLAGENTIEILKELGYSSADIDKFAEESAISSEQLNSKL